jgi:hypothetical protein
MAKVAAGIKKVSNAHGLKRVMLLIVIPLIISFVLMGNSIAVKQSSGFEHFHMFWIGFIIGLIGLSVYGLTSRSVKSAVISVLSLGFLGSVPKILLAGRGPLFHDEYAHLRTAADVARSGDVTSFNSIVNAAPLFDFMHNLTAFISKVLRVDVWDAGVGLIIFVHILTPLIVWALVRVAGFSAKAGVFAAIIYASNSNWMFFHSQYGYESLGLPIALIVLTVALFLFKKWDWGKLETKLLIVLISGLMFILSHTHHLSTVFIIFILLVITIVDTVLRFYKKNDSRWIKSLTVLVAAVVGSFKNIADNFGFILEYLSSPASNAAGQISDIISNLLFGGGEGLRSRTLFQGVTLPFYEVAFSYVSVVLMGVLVLYGLTALVPKLRYGFKYNVDVLTRESVILMAYGSLYVVSVFLILTPGGAEGARRSWGYMFIGLALISAWAWDNHISNMTNLKKFIIFICIPILYVGGTAAGLNSSYRFPLNNVNPNIISDITASSPEAVVLGEWFRDNVEPETWVLADRYSKLQLASVGRMNIVPPYTNLPYWELYFHPDKMEDNLPKIAVSTYAIGAEYMVVDTRMVTHKPELGFWFARTEADRFKADEDFFVTAEELKSIENIFFLQKEANVGPYIIFRIVFPEAFKESIISDIPEVEIRKPKDIILFFESVSRIKVDVSDFERE